MKRLTVGSLFSGIGGIDLGLERAGMEVRWHSEIDPYASRVLRKHWPHVPNLGDITKIDFAAAEPVDVLAGGFPCQDISVAGKGGGLDGERSGLWREFARALRTLEPAYALVENSPALTTRGLGVVLGELASLGYDAEWGVVPAGALGALHLRERLFVVAYPSSLRRLERLRSPPRFGRHATLVHRPLGGVERQEHFAAQPDVVRVVHGVPSRVDRLRGLGNAVVPQIPELIGGWIIEHARATGYLEEVAA